MDHLKGHFNPAIYRSNYRSSLNVFHGRVELLIHVPEEAQEYLTPTQRLVLDKECNDWGWRKGGKHEKPDAIIKRHIDTFIVVPLVDQNGLAPFTAFGGAFAWSSDSRWRKLFPAPLRIHDRNMRRER